MIMQEPKVEFVPFDFKVVTTNGGCNSAIQNIVGGGQRCFASQEDATTCPDFDTLTPW